MKERLIEIFRSKTTPEQKACEIIALAVVKMEDQRDKAFRLGEEALALQKVYEEIGRFEDSEVSISPSLFVLLVKEIKRRIHSFAIENTSAAVSATIAGLTERP